nr:immunoglobulin heavy chain junction region [Mus musculus]
CARLYYFDYW